MRITHEPLPLETQFEFRIAHAPARLDCQNVLVRLEHAGFTGLGEAAPSHYYGENYALIETALATWMPEIGEDPFALDAIFERMGSVLQENSAAHAAIDMALHDWIGQRLGLPIWKWLGLDPAATPRSCVTLGLASPDEMERKLETVMKFPILKIKLGAPGDVENLRRVRARFAGVIRVDANASWSATDAVRVLREIEPLGIELVEQPVPRADLDGLKWVRQRVGIPIFADESCHRLGDIANLAGRVDGVNLKLMKTGGLREMQRMIHAARAHGLRIMLGSMLESSLALSAAAQLAPLADHLDLDGHWLLRQDPFTGAPGEHGVIQLSDRPGLGVVAAAGNA